MSNRNSRTIPPWAYPVAEWMKSHHCRANRRDERPDCPLWSYPPTEPARMPALRLRLPCITMPCFAVGSSILAIALPNRSHRVSRTFQASSVSFAMSSVFVSPLNLAIFSFFLSGQAQPAGSSVSGAFSFISASSLLKRRKRFLECDATMSKPPMLVPQYHSGLTAANAALFAKMDVGITTATVLSKTSVGYYADILYTSLSSRRYIGQTLVFRLMFLDACERS